MSCLPLGELPTFLDRLRGYREEVERRSLITRDAVLSALPAWVRIKELRFATKTELEAVDGPEPLRRMPASGLKMGREHVVPLSTQADTTARTMTGSAKG